MDNVLEIASSDGGSTDVGQAHFFRELLAAYRQLVGILLHEIPDSCVLVRAMVVSLALLLTAWLLSPWSARRMHGARLA